MVEFIKSTQNNYWQKGQIGNDYYEDTLELTHIRKQTIIGFGVTFNELGAQALNSVDEKTKAKFLDELFLEDNCNFSYGRVPVGANDFSLDWYSEDEVDSDYELKHFNIDRDRKLTIPMVKEAMKRQKDFYLFASPWSPPTWMKTIPVYNFGTIRMEPKVLDCYARYLLKFVESYSKEGIEVRQIHLQNEPMADQKFPSCKWSGEQMRDFIKNHLGPVFGKHSPKTELWLGTINGPFVDTMCKIGSPMSDFFDQSVNTVLCDRDARKYLTGVGVQWGAKHILEQLECAYPEMKLLQTESECGPDNSNSFCQAEYIATLMWKYFKHGSIGYTYWNMALNKDGVSTWGWKQNSLAVVDTQTKTIQLTPEFYLMKHYSHFVKPGAKYIVTSGHLACNATAFQNVDGSIVIIIASNMNNPRSFVVKYENTQFSVTIEPHSINTLYIKN